MKYHLTTLILFFTLLMGLNAQSEENDENESKKEGPIIELITSGIYAYSLEEEEGVNGIEIHLTNWFNHTWGSGLSFTSKFEEDETLHDIALLGSWVPVSWLTLNAGPNFGLAGERREFEVSAYTEFEINIRATEWFHFGPIVGSIIGNNSEISGGFHLGFEF